MTIEELKNYYQKYLHLRGGDYLDLLTPKSIWLGEYQLK